MLGSSGTPPQLSELDAGGEVKETPSDAADELEKSEAGALAMPSRRFEERLQHSLQPESPPQGLTPPSMQLPALGEAHLLPVAVAPSCEVDSDGHVSSSEGHRAGAWLLECALENACEATMADSLQVNGRDATKLGSSADQVDDSDSENSELLFA